jgi:hypothetical protein
MKKLFGFLIFWFFISTAGLSGQTIPNYPIPSYNISVDGYSNFANLHSNSENNSKGRRDVNIHLKSGPVTDTNCVATVWVYRLDQSAVLGPFTVNCGETLVVGIDDGEWGVLVESDYEVIVDVWFSQP